MSAFVCFQSGAFPVHPRTGEILWGRASGTGSGEGLEVAGSFFEVQKRNVCSGYRKQHYPLA